MTVIVYVKPYLVLQTIVNKRILNVESMDTFADVKVKNFFASYASHAYAKGQVLLASGEQCHTIFYLVAGKVKIYDVTYRGEEIIVNVFKPTSFFPLSLALNPSTKNTFIYQAETDIEVIKAPANEVVGFLKSNPDVLFDLVKRLYLGVDGLLGRMVYVMSGSAKSRLLYELIIEAKRFGDMQPNGTCVLTISEKDVAARAGLTRETVSREIHKLKDKNLLKIMGKNIHIFDLESLEKYLESGHLST